MSQTIYRVRDPATGLCWNNDYYLRPRFVEPARAHAWTSLKVAETRAQRYLRRQAEGHKELAGCPSTIEIVAFAIVEQETLVVPQTLSDGQRLLLNVRTRHERGGLRGLTEELIKRKHHARYRYLVRFFPKDRYWRFDDDFKHEVDKIVALLPKKKSVLRLDTDGIALRECSELFIVMSAVSTADQIGIETLDLDEYRN